MFAFKNMFRPKRMYRPASLALGLMIGSFMLQRKSQCCGIIGVISTSNNAQVVIAEGIKLLQNRGYDSAGIATFSKQVSGPVQPEITKYAIQEEKECIEKVVQEALENHKGSFIGIGHTRWATCGGKTSPNAHPHFDETKNYYLVHNGTIVNYKELRQTYLKDKVFTSETDTEVIVQLLAKECDQNGLTVKQGLRRLQDYMIGQWGLVVISKKNPEEICVATHGSPILIGFAPESVYVASETIAFEKYTKDYVETKNGEIFSLSLDTVAELKKNMAQKGRLMKITNEVKVKLQPDPPFESFYEEQIHEQGEIKFKPYLASLDGVQFGNNLTLLGCGTSLFATMFALHFFKTLHAFKRIVTLDAAEVLQEDFQEDETVILASQSGETKDLLNALETAKKACNVRSIAIVNVFASALARKVDHVVYTNVGRQVAVGATKSFTHQILNMCAIALKIAEQKGFVASPGCEDLKADLENIQEKFKLTVDLVKERVKEIAEQICHKESLYLLAKGQALAIAKEGALKIKELCYIHAEAFGASEMKHGPLALVNYDIPKSTVVIFLILDDKNLPSLKVAIDELHSRRAFIVVITNCPEKLNREKIDQLVEVPKLKMLGSILCLPPLQLLANEICKCLKIKPDKPRNLAKTVTV